MYKIVSKVNTNEVWASGFYSKERAESQIPQVRKHMYAKDKLKELIVIKES